MQNFFEKKLLMLKPEDIIASTTQPRKSFDQYELDKLADSIAANGIIQPLAVRKLGDGKYEIIAGERRFRAAKQVGLRRIPCVIHTADEQSCAILSLTENIQRSNLSIFEEAMAIDRLINYYGITHSEAAVKLGMAQSTLSNKLRLLNLSTEIRDRIAKARLTERHARALLRIPESKRETVLDYIIANGLTLSQTEKYIDDMLQEKSTPQKPFKPLRKQAIGDVRLFYNSLSKLVSTLQSAGINARARKTETDKYIEYKVRIKKTVPQKENCEQLKIC
ncbi:MAG: ParB/RepB/Spo0J family partition protein [Clostridia bacterium]|nr:ParB/RepB/Spo0J family partition protein [Clostridia bacterium]